MVVVNAANAEEDEAWLRAVLERRWAIDRRHPARALEVDAELRNLKAASSGDARRVDSALQGPRSLAILQALARGKLKEALAGLRPFDFAEGDLAGVEAIVSRTGYTGEPLGFEIYAHPDAVPDLWAKLLATGEAHGLELAGLGARDSTRTEAGLPLHGHELAGAHDVNPIEAGYGGFVKLHKSWFVGREAMVKAHTERKRIIARFEVADPGARMLRPGAPVVESRRGKVVGTVTSCAKVGEVQIGMALLPAGLDAPGARLDIYPVPTRVPPAKAVDDLQDGDAVVVPLRATVLERFRRP
jgi:glycine hydroxymethyltransferase